MSKNERPIVTITLVGAHRWSRATVEQVVGVLEDTIKDVRENRQILANTFVRRHYCPHCQGMATNRSSFTAGDTLL